MTQALGLVKNWRMRMHDVIARGVAAARQRKRWTQEEAAREFRYHGLTTWRTSTVGSLEAGLRRPRFDEVLLMAAALEVSLEELIVGEDELVELGDGAVMTPHAIRILLRDFDELLKLPIRSVYFPGYEKLGELYARSKAEREGLEPLLEPLVRWSERYGQMKLTGGDWSAALGTPGDAERHAARRLGVHPAQLKLAARVLYRRNFAEERDARIGDAGELEPRSLQARRGLVTRAMLAQLQILLGEAYSGKPGEECQAGASK
jgi:transcriptional regulator with XRE-family HTH domain